jgi:hypothetical protein
MSQSHNHLNHATWECSTMSCLRQSTARKLCLDISGGTLELYSANWPGARNAKLREGTESLITAFGGSPSNPQLCWGY